MVIMDRYWYAGTDTGVALPRSDEHQMRRGKDVRTAQTAAIDLMLRELASSYESPANVDELSHVGAILRAIHRAPYDPQLTAGKLKACCGTHDNNVASEFKLVMGCSIMGYVVSLRLAAAALCLQRSDSAVALVARCVGFSSLQRFYAAFVRHYGQTPATYAHRHRHTSVAELRGAQIKQDIVSIA